MGSERVYLEGASRRSYTIGDRQYCVASGTVPSFDPDLGEWAARCHECCRVVSIVRGGVLVRHAPTATAAEALKRGAKP